MKSIFAAALATAFALAQNYTEPYYVEYEEPKTPLIERLPFELNEDGKYELTIPTIPKIEFTDINMDDIRAWAQEKGKEKNAWNMEWISAWDDYAAAITQPWNDLVSKAESLSVTNAQMDAQNQEDVIRFVSENTFVNGSKLADIFPQVEEYLMELQNNAANAGDMLNFDGIRMTPLNLSKYKKNNDSDSEDSNEYDEYEPTPADKIKEKIISYGYDPEVVSAWLENKGATWDELSRAQAEAKAEIAKVHIAEANTYFQTVIDNMIADLKAKNESIQAEYTAEIDARASELKAQAEKAAQDFISGVESWIESLSTKVQDFTQDTTPVIPEPIPEPISEPISEPIPETIAFA